MNLTSIYTYLEKRFGINAHKTLFSFYRGWLGPAARLYLVISILQLFIFDKLDPFEVTALVILNADPALYIRRRRKTIIYTDTLQTTGMLLGLVVCIIVIIRSMGLDFGNTLSSCRKRAIPAYSIPM